MVDPQLKNGFIRIATDIAKYLAKTYMSSYESQILWAIFVKTYGYNKKEDWISNGQFVELTDIHKAHVSRTVKKLVERKIVTQTGNKIAFQKDATLWQELPKQVTVTQTGNSVTHLGLKVTHLGLKLPKQADTIDNIQKTITKDTLQKTEHFSKIEDIDEIAIKEISDKYKVPEAFVISKLDDMTNWLGSTGKKYKDYRLALMHWVKKDALQIIQKERQTINKFSVTKIQ